MITGNIIQRLALVAALLLSGMSMQAIAQQEAVTEDQEDASAEPEEKSSGPQLDQIIVTARKTEENLQDVPLAISAFSAQEIEDAAITSFQDVANFTPGLTFSNLYGQQLPVPVIRGVAPVSVFDENATAVFVDGIFVSSREGLDLNQLDLERIEVVKGPQSAKYGRNSFSGAVNFITARPTDEFEGSAEWQVGNREKLRGSFRVSGPIIPGLVRGRFAMSHDEWAGSYDNQIPDGPNIGGFNRNAFIGGIDILPNDSLDIGIGFYRANDHFDAPAMAATPVNCEDRGEVTGAANTRLQIFCNRVPSIKQDDLATLPEESGEDTDTLRLTLTVAWDVPFGTFDLLAGHSQVENSGRLAANPGSGVWDAAYVATDGIIRLAPDLRIFQYTGLAETVDNSVEIRFATPVDNWLKGSVGAYGYQVESKGFSSPGAKILGDLPADFDGFCPCNAGSNIGDPGASLFGVGDDVFLDWMTPASPDDFGTLLNVGETDSWSVFGSLSADLGETFELSIEGRFTEEEKTNTNLTDPDVPIQNNTWDFVTWRASLSWKPTDDLHLYTGIAKGEKSGSFDTATINGDETIVLIVDPEELLAFELGAKFSLFDNRMSVDLATYIQDWSDMVVPFLIEVEFDQPTSQSVNAGDATIMGIELEVDIAITDYLTGGFGGAWQDAEMQNGNISTFKDFPSLAPDGDISGQKVHRQSEWSGNATLTYRAPLMATDFEWYARGDILYTGKQYISFANLGTIPARTTVNFRGGIDSEKYQIELWVENFFNTSSPTSAHRNVLFQNAVNGQTDFFNTFFPLHVFYTAGNLRTFGVTARIRF